MLNCTRGEGAALPSSSSPKPPFPPNTASRSVSAAAGAGCSVLDIGNIPGTSKKPSLLGLAAVVLGTGLAFGYTLLSSLDLRCNLDAAHSLSLWVEDLRSARASPASGSSEPAGESCCSDRADILVPSVARVEIDGSLFLLSNPRLRPREFLFLWVALTCSLGSSSAKESDGDDALASVTGLPGVFSHSPSLSTRLLISVDGRFLDGCSTIELMLPALSERCG